MRFMNKGGISMDLSLFSLEGKTALVTGVSRGLGQAMAIALARAGADIVGVGLRGMGDTQALVEAEGRRTYEIRADLSQRNAAERVAKEALAAFGKVDILVNNAGIIKLSPAENHTMEDFDAVMEVNLRSLFLLTREIARQMISLGHGKIINTCRPVHERRQRRCGVCRQQARRSRPDPGLGQRVGPVQHPGQRHRPRLHGDR